MKVLVTLIKKWRNRRRKTQWSNKLREIKDSFQVKELNGTLYLMCQGVPYKEVPHLLSAEEICRRNNGTARRSKRRNETLPHKQGR